MRAIQDWYFKKAKEENYLARSVYKLEEIDRKHGLVKRGIAVLDIGCAPGSWCQYILKKIGNGSVTGVDLKESVDIRDGRFRYVRGDIFALEPRDICGANPARVERDAPDAARPPRTPRFDLITSDAAPDTSGNRFVDCERSLAIVRRVFELARETLKPGGSVVAKVFQGEDVKTFVDGLRPEYGSVALSKPRSSRKESREIYIVARERSAGSD
jgi:23S rRNA (uridine2552-2'-O)-methyltransferase